MSLSSSSPFGPSPAAASWPPASATATETSNPPSSSSSAFVDNLSFPFYSGNPRIELTRGVMNLYRHKESSTDLPVGRKAMLCVLGMPNHMKYADFCLFSCSLNQHITEMRAVRIDGMEDMYGVLMKFDNQESADHFYRHLHNIHFSSFKGNVFFTVDVQYPIEHVQASVDQASCAVCLEKLDQDMRGIFTIVCNHSFHIPCVSKWTDSYCPVCQYCHQLPEKSGCFVCQTSDNLWICVICGFHGCGRFKEGHAIAHWKETQHNYSLELETQRVWDYAGGNYVHRLFQSKTDGQLWRLNPYCFQAIDSCGSSDSQDAETVNESNELVTTQLKKPKLYYESLLKHVEKAMNLKLQEMQAKLDKSATEKAFLDDLNKHLLENQEIWKAKIIEIEEREKKALQLKDERIQDLEDKLVATSSKIGDIITRLEAYRDFMPLSQKPFEYRYA